MNPALRLRAIGLALAAMVYAVDQWIKGQVRGPVDLANTGPIDIVSFFALRWTENYGVSLGMFTAQSVEMRWGLVAVTGLIALGVLVWMLREKSLPEIAGLGMVLGGALGNIRDRYRYGYVIDYADLHFGDFRPFMIFNLADAAITVGVLIILARSFLSREKRVPPAGATTDATES